MAVGGRRFAVLLGGAVAVAAFAAVGSAQDARDEIQQMTERFMKQQEKLMERQRFVLHEDRNGIPFLLEEAGGNTWALRIDPVKKTRWWSQVPRGTILTSTFVRADPLDEETKQRRGGALRAIDPAGTPAPSGH